jgi:hypothetical protein
VLDYNGSEDMAIAALLHDVVEDQGGEAPFPGYLWRRIIRGSRADRRVP